MRFRASNLYVLAGIVLAIAAVVMLTYTAQRSASDESSSEQKANAALLASGLAYLEAGEQYVFGGDRKRLIEWDLARQGMEQSIAELGQVVDGEPRKQELYDEQVTALRELLTLSGLAIEKRRFGGGPGTVGELEARLGTFDDAAAANRELADLVDQERKDSQRLTGIVSLLAVVLLGCLILALGVAARRDDARRRRDNRFSESLQSARTETEAYGLVRDHLVREVSAAEVTVFNRNNSANRLEASTPIDPDSPLAEAVAGAKPDDCLAVRSAKASSGGTGPDDLLRCEICGKQGKSSLCTPSIVGGEVIGSVLVQRPSPLDESAKRTVAASVTEAAPTVAHLRSLALAERRASSDTLTGLANKRSAEDTLKRMVANARRTNSHLALIALDLDHFKRVNDTYGHPKGDEVLAAVGNTITGVIRENDFAGRDGGEEFIVLLPGSDLDGARTVAEKLREAIAALRVDGVMPGITASCGVVCMPDDADNRETLVRKADRALYAAKRAGRNRVATARDAETREGDGNGSEPAAEGPETAERPRLR